MEALSKYILSVISAAFIVGILSALTDKKGSSGWMRLVCGLFLTFVMISPVVKMDFSGITDFLTAYAAEGEDAAASGQLMAQEEYRTIIKQQAEAYILDKASDLGASLTAEVTLSDDDGAMPEAITLRGNISPYAKQKLQQGIEEDLGIAKENQTWIG